MVGIATCWGPNTWPFTCFVKLLTRTAIATSAVEPKDFAGSGSHNGAWFKWLPNMSVQHISTSSLGATGVNVSECDYYALPHSAGAVKLGTIKPVQGGPFPFSNVLANWSVTVRWRRA